MVIEDTEKEIEESSADDKANQAKYEKNNCAFHEMLDAQTASKVEMEKESTDLEQKMQDAQATQEGKYYDLSEAQASEGILSKDCAWVKLPDWLLHLSCKDEQCWMRNGKAAKAPGWWWMQRIWWCWHARTD
jgi:hypothetical protein